MSFISYIFPQKLAGTSSRFNKKIDVIESYGTTQLLVNGVVQTGTYTHALFKNGLQTLSNLHQDDMSRILVLGIGGGGVFSQLREQYPDAQITGVDIDPEIIRLAGIHFGLNRIKNTQLVCSDAYTYVKILKRGGTQFDCVIIDIYTGNDVPDFVSTEDFLRSVHRIIRPGGSMVWNFFSYTGQKEKSDVILTTLERVYARVFKEHNQKNIFYFCTA